MLTWDYPTTGEVEEPSAEAVLKEMNGYTWPDRRQLEDVHEYQGRRLDRVRRVDL